MNFCIITHVPHGKSADRHFAYGPYVREMDIWMSFAQTITVVAPDDLQQRNPIHQEYSRPVSFVPIKSLNFQSIFEILRSLIRLPGIALAIFSAMRKSDHIHLRCPGNIGLIGCFLQILFPTKKKTAKYAGNWDPNSAQPLSYRLQKWILNNTFLTRNMQVLVYGEWPGSSKNIRPFFTATYPESFAGIHVDKSPDRPIRLIFAGALAPGKRPVYAAEIANRLLRQGIQVSLDFYGDGAERKNLETFIADNQLERSISLKGNCDAEEIMSAYRQSHFLLLPSKSEGWPKVVAEAMFWGCVPVATPVSCVPQMLGHGSRGLLASLNADSDAAQMIEFINDDALYQHTSEAAMHWSRKYTTDLFRSEIEKLMQP